MRRALAAVVLFATVACRDQDAPVTDGETGTATGLDGSTATAADATGLADSTGDPATALFPPIGSLVAPEGAGSFRFGAASAATQIEDDNPAVDWWTFTASPPDGLGNHTFVGDASRGYSMALQDVELIAALGLDSYRFSIEWARVEPERDVIDEGALEHYDALIDALVAAGVRPMITVHHFSNPTWVDDPRDKDCVDGPSDANLCGWDHAEGGPLVVEELAQHAALLASRYGDRVDEWATLNEPINYLLGGYGIGTFPPGKNGLLLNFDAVFVGAARNLVAGHAAAYHAIKDGDAVDADGDGVAAAVGFTKGAQQWVAARDGALSTDPEDVAARDRVAEFYHHLFVRAALEGVFDADLDGEDDEAHPEWAGTLDWLGLQYYFRSGVTSEPGILPGVAATPCFGAFDFGACVPPLDESYVVPAMHYEHNPAGLYEVLADFSTRWPLLPLIVSESGIATDLPARRTEVIVRALEQIERARAEGIDVRGYYHWSIFDNYEWAEGFVPRFGLYRVDYDSYERGANEATEVYAEIIDARDFPGTVRADYGGSGPLTPEP